MTLSVRMIDVSKWQASNREHPPVIPMNFAAAKAQGVQGTGIKATEGLDTDPELTRSHANAGAQRLKRLAYHFFRAWTTGVKQAEYFLSVMGSMPWEMPPWLDVEVKCTARQLWDFAVTVHDRSGVWCDIYTGPNTWTNQVVDSKDPVSGKTYKRLIAEHCNLIQAQYPNAEYDDGVRVMPLSPIEPWDTLKKPPVVHQYSCKNGLGRLYGSRGAVSIDLDLADDIWFAQFPWPDGQDDDDPIIIPIDPTEENVYEDLKKKVDELKAAFPGVQVVLAVTVPATGVSSPEIPEDSEPEDPVNYAYYKVAVEKTVSRYAITLNKAGRPIMVIYPSEKKVDQAKRVIFEKGDTVAVIPGAIKADGGIEYYRLANLAPDKRTPLYVAKSDVG